MKIILLAIITSLVFAGCTQDIINQVNPSSGNTVKIHVTKFGYNITKQQMNDKTPYYVFKMQIFFEGNEKINTPEYQKSNVSISSSTVDEKGKTPNFLNEENFLKIDDEYVYGLKEGSFSAQENILDTLPHNYTTTFTLTDHYGNATAQKIIKYEIPLKTNNPSNAK